MRLHNPVADTIRAVRELPRQVQILILGHLINSMGVMIVPYMSLVLVQKLGFRPSTAGLVIGLYALGSITAVLTAGLLADRFGRRPVMLISLFGGGAVAILLGQIHTTTVYAATLVIFGFLIECYRPASSALVSDLLPEKDRAQGLAAVRVSMNLGFMLAVVFGGFVFAWDWRAMFWIDGLTTILFGLLVYSKIRDTKITRRTSSTQPTVRAIQNPKLMKLWLASFLVSYAYSTHSSALPLTIVRDGGYSASTVGLLLGLNGGMVALFEVGVVARLSLTSPVTRMASGAALVALGLAFTGLFSHWAWYATTIVIWTAGEILSFAIMGGYTTTLAPIDRRGEYLGWIQSSWRLAGVIGPPTLLFGFECLGIWFWPLASLPAFISIWLFLRLKE